MKIKYTVVYEVETDDMDIDDWDSIGFIKRLNVENIRKRYAESETVKMISNDFEVTFSGNALEVPA